MRLPAIQIPNRRLASDYLEHAAKRLNLSVPRRTGFRILIVAPDGTHSLAVDRVDEGSVASDIPYFDAGPLPTLGLCAPLERGIAERAGLVLGPGLQYHPKNRGLDQECTSELTGEGFRMNRICRLIGPLVLAIGLVGGSGANIASAQTNNPPNRSYEDRSGYPEHISGGSNWGWLGLLGLFGLIGARRTRVVGTYETDGTTYEPRPTR